MSLRTATSESYHKTRRRIHALKNDTPHRSFRRTRRRDMSRTLELPGYIGMTILVWRTLWRYKWPLLILVAIYAVLSAVFTSIGNETTYNAIRETITLTSGNVFTGTVGTIAKAVTLFATSVNGGITTTPTEAQQIYTVILVLFLWLTTVWLLRNLRAGNPVKLRDALYNAGAPLVPTFLIGLVLLLQLIPIALAMFGYSAASQGALLNGGGATMLFWLAFSLLVLLSVYWVTSTLIALVIVTIPGMYPMQALHAAGELVRGRRLRIVLRIVWLLVMTAIAWVVIMIPLILANEAIVSVWSGFANVPVVPIALLILTSVSVLWGASYVYLLYRSIVDYDAQ